MSRKHPPIPDTDGLTLAKAIARDLVAFRSRGEKPVSIAIGPAVFERLHRDDLVFTHSGPSRYSIFNVRVVVDDQVERWEIRGKS